MPPRNGVRSMCCFPRNVPSILVQEKSGGTIFTNRWSREALKAAVRDAGMHKQSLVHTRAIRSPLQQSPRPREGERVRERGRAQCFFSIDTLTLTPPPSQGRAEVPQGEGPFPNAFEHLGAGTRLRHPNPAGVTRPQGCQDDHDLYPRAAAGAHGGPKPARPAERCCTVGWRRPG